MHFRPTLTKNLCWQIYKCESVYTIMYVHVEWLPHINFLSTLEGGSKWNTISICAYGSKEKNMRTYNTFLQVCPIQQLLDSSLYIMIDLTMFRQLARQAVKPAWNYNKMYLLSIELCLKSSIYRHLQYYHIVGNLRGSIFMDRGFLLFHGFNCLQMCTLMPIIHCLFHGFN